MRRARLDGSLSSPAAVYDRLARDLELAPTFGRNLDALWDSLSRDVPGPFEIVWRDADKARAALGESFVEFESLFRELEAERADFRFRLLP
jgi:ribonuclease inhibitor